MKTNTIFLMLILSLFLTTNLFAQNPTLEWAKGMGGTGYDGGSSITTDANGNVYTTGYFEGTVDFDPDTATFNLTSNGSFDIFVQKLSQNQVTSTREIEVDNAFAEHIEIYPNPTNEDFVIKFESTQGTLAVRLLSVLGQEIQRNTFEQTDFVQMSLTQPNGIYFVEIENEEGKKAVFRLVKK